MIHDWTQLFAIIAFVFVIMAIPTIAILVLARFKSQSREVELPSIVDNTEKSK